MKAKPKVIILRTAGTNCDAETVFAFKSCGADVDLVHINKIFRGDVKLADYHILAIPGGFTYGDDIESGRILANELRAHLGENLKKFMNDGKLMIGICNGFQVMVRAGILPGAWDGESDFNQSVTLTNNDSGKFEDRWVHLKVSRNSPWTKDMGEVVYFPVAHAEGKFIPQNEEVLNRLKQNNQVAFRYCRENGHKPQYPEIPNGSVDEIAGITDKTGRILGLMPHPERHFLRVQHPFWTRIPNKSKFGDGAKIFENGVDYIEKNLL